MGRITVFTVWGDLNSKQALKELERRNLPYAEIDLAVYPSKVSDLEALVGTASVPHVFFHGRCIGGLDQVKQELKRWEYSKRLYQTPLERYQAEIASPAANTADPIVLQRLTLPDPAKAIPITAAVARESYQRLDLPEGMSSRSSSSSSSSCGRRIRKWMVKLEEWIQPHACVYKGVTYANSFSGQTLLQTLQVRLFEKNDDDDDDIDVVENRQKKALKFAQELLDKGVIRHVVDYPLKSRRNKSKQAARMDNDSVYRLQCHAEPTVLNSFLMWQRQRQQPPPPSPCDVSSSGGSSTTTQSVSTTTTTTTSTTTSMDSEYCLQLIYNLHHLLTVLELSSIDAEDGLLNAQHAVGLKKFVHFEETICELQTIPKSCLLLLSESEMTSFALNLYNVLIRYAYLKVGIPKTHADYLDLLQRTKFILAGETHTLQYWVDILTSRSIYMMVGGGGDTSHNSSSCFSSSAACEDSSSTHSAQSYYSINRQHDRRRIHMALFIGPHGGSRWSPPFTVYTPEHLDKQLDMAARVFCLDSRHVHVNRKENKVELIACVFQNNAEVFGDSPRTILKDIVPYLTGKQRSDASVAMLATATTTTAAATVTATRGGLLDLRHVESLGWGDYTVAGPWYQPPQQQQQRQRRRRSNQNDSSSCSPLATPTTMTRVLTRQASMGKCISMTTSPGKGLTRQASMGKCTSTTSDTTVSGDEPVKIVTTTMKKERILRRRFSLRW